jgi:hypothetical protein
MNKIVELNKIEKQRNKIIDKIKEEIRVKRGNLHDWDYISVHHGWTFWYECRLCGIRNGEDRELSKEKKEEKCPFFDKDFIPDMNDLREYLK